MKKQLQVFFSYGHSSDNSPGLPSVVNWLKEKIANRNHNVFIDVEQLPRAYLTNWPNNSWRSAIYQGINQSDSVLGLLSHRGLRDNGVCLDELSIAVSNPGRNIVTILLDEQACMKIPPTISRIQWVDMSKWREKSNNGTDFNNSYFEEIFNDIINRIEDTENFSYQSDINFLMKTLNPSDTVKTSLFDLLRKEYNEKGVFVYKDRAWLNDIVKEFILTSNKNYLLLIGGAGYGKSQFMAHCIHNIEDVCSYFFIKYDKAESDCNLFLRTLAFELAAKLPDYRQSLIASIKGYSCFSEGTLDEVYAYYRKCTDSNLFDLLFHCDSVNTIYGGDKIIICIDALDEADVCNDTLSLTNPIIDLITYKQHLWPNGFKFILTSRDEQDIVNRLEVLGTDIEVINLKNDIRSDEDICAYLKSRLDETKLVNEEFIQRLVNICEKSFIYADLLIKSIDTGTIRISSEDDLKALPTGYKGLLLNYFRRLFPNNSFEDVKIPLGIMVLNNGSISIPVINEIMRQKKPDWNHISFISRMKSFVVESGNELIFYHKSVNEWLTDKGASEYYLCPEDYVKHIIDFDKSYLFEFDALRDTYSGATGYDLFSDATDNGYNYEVVKYVYNSYMKLAPILERRNFKNKYIHFITLVIYLAYQNSDLYFAHEVFDTIKPLAAKGNELSPKERFYIGTIYTFMCEIEIAKGNEVPNNFVDTESTVDAYNCKYAIDYCYFIIKLMPELDSYPGLYRSTMDNICFISRHLPDKRESALQTINELKSYVERSSCDDKSNSYMHLYYHESTLLYKLLRPKDAIKSLNQALIYLEQYEKERGIGYSNDRMRCLICNQLGACNHKIAQLLIAEHKDTQNEEIQKYCLQAVKYAKESLRLRIKEFGSMSFYVATAYDNYARWKMESEIYSPDFVKLSDDVYNAIAKAIYIREYLFTDTGIATARSYMTMALCLAEDHNFEMALYYAYKAYNIAPETYSEELDELKQRKLEFEDK